MSSQIGEQTPASSTEMARKPAVMKSPKSADSGKSAVSVSASSGATGHHQRGYTDDDRKKESAASSHNEVHNKKDSKRLASRQPSLSPNRLKLKDRIQKFEAAASRGSVSPLPLQGPFVASNNLVVGNERSRQPPKGFHLTDSGAENSRNHYVQHSKLKYHDQSTSMTAKRPRSTRGNESPPSQFAANILKSSLRGLLKLQGFLSGTTRLYVNGDLEAEMDGGESSGGEHHHRRNHRRRGRGCCQPQHGAKDGHNGLHNKSRVRVVDCM